MATDIDLCSNALLLIGDNAITSFSSSGLGAEVSSNLYTQVYQSCLAEHPWSFAMKEQYLSRLTATPDDETNYSYAFQLPVDVIRIWSVMPHSNYIIVGDLLYSNELTLLCRYVYEVDEAYLPAYFYNAITYKLASEFAVAITEDVQKAAYYEQKYMQAIQKAKSIESQGKPQVAIVDSPFLAVR